MKEIELNLSENETIIKTIVSSLGKEYEKIILTDKRIIFNSFSFKGGYVQEDYPLSKITSIKMSRKKNDYHRKVLIRAIIGLVVLISITSLVIINGGSPSFHFLFIPFYLYLFWRLYVGLKPDRVITYLTIGQFGAEKNFLVFENQDLIDFVNEAKKKLV